MRDILGISEARRALGLYAATGGDLGAALRQTFHGSRITAIGFGADVDRCGTADVYDTVATLRIEDGRAVLRPIE